MAKAQFHDKHWVVTGASRGIGFELVKQLLKTDEQVTALARNAPAAKDLQQLLRDYPARLRIYEADVTKDLDLDRVVKALADQPVDVLINNAGIYQDGHAGALQSLDLGSIEQMLLVNSVGPMRVTRAFMPLLARSEQPVIANITSQMGSIADNSSGGSYGYRMSKAALNMFTKTLAIDVPKAIVLSLHPGWVQTDMGGSSAPITTLKSATGLLEVIRSATPKNSGQFLNYSGDHLEW